MIGETHFPPHHQYLFSKKSFEYIAKEFGLKITHYQKTDVQERHYLKYIDLTGDNISYEECNKKFTGHSHVVVFEKI